MGKMVWPVVFIAFILLVGFLFSFLASSNKDGEVEGDQVDEIIMEDTEEVAEVVSYIKEAFGDNRVKKVRFDPERQTIAVDTRFTKKDLKEGTVLEEELTEELQKYNQSGERISYKVEVNFRDGTIFSSIVILNES